MFCQFIGAKQRRQLIHLCHLHFVFRFLHKNEDATSRYLFFPEESECDFGHQCTISVRSKSAPKIVSVPVVPHEDFIVVHHQNECETSNQATNGCLMPV